VVHNANFLQVILVLLAPEPESLESRPFTVQTDRRAHVCCMINPAILLAATLILGLASAAQAETPPDAQVYRLSPEALEAIQSKADARAKTDTSALSLPTPRAVHGEIGFGIGTSGYRSVFGTALVPLGTNGILALSFENSQFGNGGRRR
jgi:hypothetical protein